MLYPELEKILLDNGYHVSEGYAYSFLDNMLEAVDWVHSITNKAVIVGVQPTDEYEEEIKNLPAGTEFEVDTTRLEVISIFLESVFVPECGYMDNSRDGILLQDKVHKYCLLDTISGPDGMKGYYTHDFSYLETAIHAQLHPFEQELTILKAHIKNLTLIELIYKPILDKYDFFESYSSLFDVTKENYNLRDTSDPSIMYEFQYPSITHKNIWFSTDCLDGTLKINGRLPPEDFEDWLINHWMSDDLNILLEFKYLFDSEYLPKLSYHNVYEIYQTLDSYEKGWKTVEDLKNLSWEGVPMKDYQYLKDRVNKIINDVV